MATTQFNHVTDPSEALAVEFAPGILQAQNKAPSPLPRLVLYCLLALFAVMLAWAALGKLDIVAVAQGKLVPQTYVKVVQPADPGIIREILVKEGDTVVAGQVLMRMDTNLSEADRKVLDAELQLKALTVRRIDAELEGSPLLRRPGEAPEIFRQVEAQFRARRQAYQDTLAAERAVIAKAQQDLKGAGEIEGKLRQTAPIYQEQERAWEQLAREGFAGRLLALERSRNRIENEQDLRAQSYTVASLRATVDQSDKRIAQITSNYRQQLYNERLDAEAQRSKLEQDLAKHVHRHGLLELRAPDAGMVKDLATHTAGTVVIPGTVLATLVPRGEPLQAEVWVSNLDSGFVHKDQNVRLKLMAYPFQHFGLVDGVVTHVSADASDRAELVDKSQPAAAPLYFRALVSLPSGDLQAQGQRHALHPGMQVSAEIHLGTRTVLEYLLSPIQRTLQEAWRER